MCGVHKARCMLCFHIHVDVDKMLKISTRPVFSYSEHQLGLLPGPNVLTDNRVNSYTSLLYANETHADILGTVRTNTSDLR